MTSPALLHRLPIDREVIDQPQQIGSPLCDLATARGIEALVMSAKTKNGRRPAKAMTTTDVGLRDYFAAQALITLGPTLANDPDYWRPRSAQIARACFSFADAMLRAREDK